MTQLAFSVLRSYWTVQFFGVITWRALFQIREDMYLGEHLNDAVHISVKLHMLMRQACNTLVDHGLPPK